jgi:hypothetical protein
MCVLVRGSESFSFRAEISGSNFTTDVRGCHLSGWPDILLRLVSRHLAKKSGEGSILVDDSNTGKSVTLFRDENIKFESVHDAYFEDYSDTSHRPFNALASRLFSEVITEAFLIHSSGDFTSRENRSSSGAFQFP